MGECVSFKERVRLAMIAAATDYKNNFIDYEYLVYSDSFENKDYYIIDAKEDNYQHLTGVNSLISASSFFEKCYNGTLQESDFDFSKKEQDEKIVKGTVRRKISVLPHMMNIFSKSLMVEECFQKNTVICSFATTDGQLTLGFIDSGKSRPKTLIKGDGLNKSKSKPILLVLRKKSDEALFSDIVIGDLKLVKANKHKFEAILSEKLINQVNMIEPLPKIESKKSTDKVSPTEKAV